MSILSLRKCDRTWYPGNISDGAPSLYWGDFQKGKTDTGLLSGLKVSVLTIVPGLFFAVRYFLLGKELGRPRGSTAFYTHLLSFRMKTHVKSDSLFVFPQWWNRRNINKLRNHLSSYSWWQHASSPLCNLYFLTRILKIVNFILFYITGITF